MGGNGTASEYGYVAEKNYSGQGVYNDPVFGEIHIVSYNTGQDKTPEESNTPNRVYVTFRQNGSDVNEIAKYGSDHKKEWAIHTKSHDSKKAKKKGEAVSGPHIHYWKDGHPVSKPQALTPKDPRYALLQRVRNFQKSK